MLFNVVVARSNDRLVSVFVLTEDDVDLTDAGIAKDRGPAMVLDGKTKRTRRGAAHDHNDPAVLRIASLYAAVVSLCPRALPYLAFPPGATIAIGAALSFFMEGEPVLKGSFVDLQRRQGAG